MDTVLDFRKSKNIYHRADSRKTTFDAGGSVDLHLLDSSAICTKAFNHCFEYLL